MAKSNNQHQITRRRTPLWEFTSGKLRQFGARVSWLLFVHTLIGIGLIGITIMLWLQEFDVIEQAPLLIVMVGLWFIFEVLLWPMDSRS